ncbi:MAG: type II toxin-antitoxin system Phd/YefM family antitoxin [Dehalococcoidia bacterium]|nr:type II toxin-antitoxin system Phd/YefM family antitoxin [Dehalococcoidia bacterium]
MKRTINAMQARQKLGEILEGVFYKGDEVVIERAGKAMGVIIPLERYQSIERARERFFATVDKIREDNLGVDPDQVERDVAQALAEVREERRRTRAEKHTSQ